MAFADLSLRNLLSTSTLLFSCVLASPAKPLGVKAASVSAYVSAEVPLALNGILDNIGPDGRKVAGTASGFVVASPSKNNPDYLYTWTRDAALTIVALVDEVINNKGNQSLISQIDNYVYSQARLQTVSSRSGGLQDGKGLAEPKYEVDGSPFSDDWGRPQRDGPALRATTLITYARYLIGKGKKDLVTSTLWPIISNDLNYVGQYWNQTGFDLWEEINGSSFFTIAVQHRALREGDALAKQIGKTCNSCSQAPQILCFLQSFWNGKYIVANLNQNSGRAGVDVNGILGSIHTFDPSATCESKTFQPCSSRALANHKVVTDSFRSIYGINKGIPQGAAVAVGRYPEDVYQGGHPWYLATLAAAEQLYDALIQWQNQGKIDVDQTSVAFFKDLVPTITPNTYKNDSQTYTTIMKATRSYADDFVLLVSKYTPANGSLAEQFHKTTGVPLSAGDLTWSYASFLTTVARSKGQVPASWGSADATKALPSTCSSSSVQGTYSVPNVTVPLAPCSSPSTITVLFSVAATTEFGETILLTGTSSQLGSNDRAKAVRLSADSYQPSYNRWWVKVKIPAGSSFTYNYLKQGRDGQIRSEKTPARNYSVGNGCASDQVVVGTSSF